MGWEKKDYGERSIGQAHENNQEFNQSGIAYRLTNLTTYKFILPQGHLRVRVS